MRQGLADYLVLGDDKGEINAGIAFTPQTMGKAHTLIAYAGRS